jgi:hypothetical protein
MSPKFGFEKANHAAKATRVDKRDDYPDFQIQKFPGQLFSKSGWSKPKRGRSFVSGKVKLPRLTPSRDIALSRRHLDLLGPCAAQGIENIRRLVLTGKMKIVLLYDATCQTSRSCDALKESFIDRVLPEKWTAAGRWMVEWGWGSIGRIFKVADNNGAVYWIRGDMTQPSRPGEQRKKRSPL